MSLCKIIAPIFFLFKCTADLAFVLCWYILHRDPHLFKFQNWKKKTFVVTKQSIPRYQYMPLRIWHSIRFRIFYLIKFIWLRIRVETRQKLAEPPNSCSLKNCWGHCRDGSTQIVIKFPKKINVLWKNSKELLKSYVKKSTDMEINSAEKRRADFCKNVFGCGISKSAEIPEYGNAVSNTAEKQKYLQNDRKSYLFWKIVIPSHSHTHRVIFTIFFIFI